MQYNAIFNEAEAGMAFVFNEQLKKLGPFVCGTSLSVADIAIYCELVTIMMLTEQTADFLFEHNLQHVGNWYNKLSEFPVLAELNSKLQEII